jgi:HK97 family phage major capsid protein
MTATDAMVSRLQAEIEERTAFQNQLIEGAQNAGRDLNAQEMELYNSAAERITACDSQLGPLAEGVRIARESATRSRELTQSFTAARTPQPTVEYRTAGEYIVDRWQAGAGFAEAQTRMAIYERAAAHQTTPDNMGLIPTTVVAPVINFIDASRPIVNALGPRAVPGGQFTRPRVTQHTDAAIQSAEKTELVSRKMLITGVAVTMKTYGGYVNVSRQNIDWSVPQIMDIVVADLAGQYAIETEQVTAAALEANAVAQTPALPATPTPADVSAAIWKAAGAAYVATAGVGSLVLCVAPDVMGLIGPLFAPVNPTNSQSSGFNAGSFGSGPQGSISGIAVVMSTALTAGTALMVNTAAAEVYEQRIGTLSVTEPSVLGVQVAYAGYFSPAIIQASGIIKLDAVP